ncbi:hypothetical protein OQH61_01970 [Helicobacter sp. MIT 21-1697]|uniref:hypothetical protein n=1 Tax=Helicobacter sp. MIT 21-1697 TaxID=2993733 RepID=UPI00224B57C2|nr:hypothetical protein [Helicobacter sp. MIT 21-1697]MCX2716498.1 hypothetical protein [Helicobacter sp. MIT 21-1697]
MFKGLKSSVRQIKQKVKEAKNAKKIAADKQSLNPQHYPLQLSENEQVYVCNALISAGGGHIWSLVQVVLPFWRFYSRKCAYSAWNLIGRG